MLSGADEVDLKARVAVPEEQLAELASAPLHFVRLGPDAAIRRDQVASVRWDRRSYMNGSTSHLIIRMMDGAEHRLEHRFGMLGGPDCYAIEEEILGAR